MNKIVSFAYTWSEIEGIFQLQSVRKHTTTLCKFVRMKEHKIDDIMSSSKSKTDLLPFYIKMLGSFVLSAFINYSLSYAATHL